MTNKIKIYSQKLNFFNKQTIQSVFANDDDDEETEENLSRLSKKDKLKSLPPITRVESKSSSKSKIDLNEDEKQEIIVKFL